ncbi:hypothetical protein FM076_32960 [Streptomyces albus subsp. chlorinus]|uniref:hypothetical protein n=1 Tax=Streptomyces albus TaxID=1888 RepID=UPI0015711EB0|nr:hypothetical protein [Streptomyces albus]NSC25700.1 hypothetical protein [Streptomyces albus subsp. chlorinus]
MDHPLLTARSALVLLLALLAGLAAAALTVWAGSGVPHSVLCGAGSTALGVVFNQLVAPEQPARGSRDTDSGGGARGL